MRQRILYAGLALVIIAILLPTTGNVVGLTSQPPVRQIHRFIRITNTLRAGDIRWVETWESVDDVNGIHQLVMREGRGWPDTLDTECYYALAVGENVPVYMVDFELVPVTNASTLFNSFANRGLLDESVHIATDIECSADAQDMINGIGAEHCAINQDALHVIGISGTATGQGNLWRALDGGFPVRYDFIATGELNSAFHSYELTPINSVPISTGTNAMLCFANGFPMPDQVSQVAVQTQNYLMFWADNPQPIVESQIDSNLNPPWTSVANTPGPDGPIITYTRTLSNGSQCRLAMRYSTLPGRIDTLVVADVFPAYVNFDNVPLPTGVAGPIVVMAFGETIEGSVDSALRMYSERLETEEWVRRDELTDIRSNSAFVTYARDDFETYIIVDGITEDQVTLRVETRTATCGPTTVLNPE